MPRKPFDDKYQQLANKTTKYLQKQFPGKKVEVRLDNADRPLSSQANLLKKGASQTTVSLHNVGAARDYHIYIDDKFIPNTQYKVYKASLWKAAEELGMYHLDEDKTPDDPTPFGKTDPYHIGVVKETNDHTAITRLLQQYPEVANTALFKATEAQLSKAPKSDTIAAKAYAQIQAFRGAPIVQKPKEVVKEQLSPSASLSRATDKIRKLPILPDELLPAYRNEFNPGQVNTGSFPEYSPRDNEIVQQLQLANTSLLPISIHNQSLIDTKPQEEVPQQPIQKLEEQKQISPDQWYAQEQMSKVMTERDKLLKKEFGGTMKKTSRKVLNKIMPIKADEGAIIKPSVTSDNPPGMSSPTYVQPHDAYNPWGPTPVAPSDSSDPSHSVTETPNNKGFFEKHPFHVALKLASTDLIAGAISAASGAIPDQIKQDNQNHTPLMYNPRSYGDNTQAIAKYGLSMDNGGVLNRDNWNALNIYAQHNAENYGGDQYNHGNYGNSIIEAFNKANPTQAIQPQDVGLYQQDMLNNPSASRAGSGTFSPNDKKYGKDTMQQSYVNYATVVNGKETPFKTNQAAALKNLEGDWTGFGDPTQDVNYKASEVPVVNTESKQRDSLFPTREQAIANKRTQKANWHTDENADYGKSGIHIKPENKGKFNALKKRTGKSTEELTHSSNPLTRKRAVFAKNAKHWHHGEDGLDLDPQDQLYAADGIQILGEGGIRPYGTNSQSKPMHVSEGPSHEDGGIPMNVNGQRAEIQGGEGVQQYPDGATLVFGGMRIPNLGPETKGLAGKTFQSIAKNIAEQEEKNTKTLAVPSQQTDGLNPGDRFDSLELGSKIAKGIAFSMRSKALTAQKNHLRAIQDMMHQDAEMTGIDPSKAHTIYAKQGATIKAKGGAKFDQKIKEEQSQMLKDHSDWVDEALTKYGKPSSGRFDDGLEGPRTQFVRNYVAKKTQESSGRPQEIISKLEPAGLKRMGNEDMSQLDAAPLKMMPTPIENKTVQPVELPKIPTNTSKKAPEISSLADQNHLRASDFLSELSYLGKRPDQVVGQEYKPYLETPYQVSFQDRRNQNQATFNELSKQLQSTGSAASLATLAGQKYEADNQVNSEEFRTNQGIFNQITNQNYATLNDAAKTNISLKDQQYVRQSQAKSNTDAQRAQVLASISNKIAANRYENMNIRLTEQRSGYRWNPDSKKLEWEGGPYQFNPYGSGMANNTNQGWNETQKYDKGTGQWEDDTRTRKAMSKFGNVFGRK